MAETNINIVQRDLKACEIYRLFIKKKIQIGFRLTKTSLIQSSFIYSIINVDVSLYNEQMIVQ